MELSIIIVHYQNKEVLFDCLDSIFKAAIRFSSEIIVVDNDEIKTINQELKSKYPKVKYVESFGNIGFGAGNNLGVKNSTGRFLFFLNPDTKITSGAIEKLINFLKKNRKVGVVAPLLCHPDLKPFRLQGSLALNPISGIFALSFLNKIFPNNRISQKYFLTEWNKEHKQEVDAVPGSVLMIRRSIFDQVNGFDENFFLYFEESDLCKRVSEAGFKIYILPEAKIIHHLSQSTPKEEKIKKIFKESRFYYFQKHYGIFWAIIVNFFTSLSIEKFLLTAILLMAIFLRFYRLPELLSFGGDVARDYISSRDIILKGKLPLLGCPSSVPWLHQGALFTYLLAIVLWLGKYDPVAGGYFVGALGVLGVLGVYLLGRKFFSNETGLLAAFFYATSPLIVVFERYPYHLSPISFFAMLFFASLFSSFENVRDFILASLLFGLLMQLELSNLVLLPVWVIILLELRYKINIKILVLSLLAFLVPWTPKIVYDINNGFTQTIGFLAWIFHKLPPINFFMVKETGLPLLTRIETIFVYLSRIIFWKSIFLSAVIFVFSVLFLIKSFNFKKRKNQLGIYLILLWIIVPLSGFIVQGSPSESYTPVLFAPIALLLSCLLCFVPPRRRLGGTIMILMFIFLGIFNSYFLIKNNFFILTDKPTKDSLDYNLGYSLSLKREIARFIVSDSQNRNYNLIPLGSYGFFPSGKLDLVYLTWFLGNEPKEDRQKLVFFAFNPKDKIEIKNNWIVEKFPYLTIAKSINN